MRDGPGETATVIPLAARMAVIRVQPPTSVVAERGQEARAAARIRDGRMHDDDVLKTKGFNFLVREIIADKAANLGVRIGEVLTVGKCPGLGVLTHVLRQSLVVPPELGWQNGDAVDNTGGRLELFGAKDAFGVIAQVIALLLEVSDPLFPCPSGSGGKGDIDHAVGGDCPLRFETLLVILN